MLMTPTGQIRHLRLFSGDVSSRQMGTIQQALANGLGRDPK